MNGSKILWVDDEIDLLKIHILFLEEKGHQVKTSNNGNDALDIIKEENFDIIFLDENMPGKSGLDVLPEFKKISPNTPVVMITKNEEEDIMDEAIGSKIDDYLIKPVNPKQILLSIKKNVENKRLITEKTTSLYQTEFRNLSELINNSKTSADWIEVYKQLVFWETKLDDSQENTMDDILQTQKEQANVSFCKFIKKEYENWMDPENENRPNFLFNFFRQKTIPLLDKGEKIFVIVIDNLRLDHWKRFYPVIEQYMQTEEEEVWYSILPTATQYARNALFAGLTPYEISKRHPEYWSPDEEEGPKNNHEEELLKLLFERYRRKVKFGYEKIHENKYGEKVIDNFSNLLRNQLNVVVYNFIDALSHARTDVKMIRELANSDAAYRSLALTWFEHSSMLDLIKKLAEHKITAFIITDHGAINVKNPLKVVGDKQTSSNLRYKLGRNLSYNKNEVFVITDPVKAGLPISNISSKYIFASNNDFLAFRNNFNHYARYYKDTFQHGGISLEEMLIPVIKLVPK